MIPWNESLQTGHAGVDADHCRIISLLNDLERDIRARAAPTVLAETIRLLHANTKAHFTREEAHMFAVGCPAYHRNCAEHVRFAARLDLWMQQLEQSGPSAELAFNVFHDTANWLSTHISGTDCELRECPVGRH